MSIKNVLLIIADDWSPIAGCYGDSIVKTPHIDALAKRSLLFNQAYCTSPSCAASRANILTGHYSHTHGQYGHCHGVHDFRTRPGIATLPGILKEIGIFSAQAGKTHFAPDDAYPFDYRDSVDIMALSKFSNRHLADAMTGCFQRIGDKPFFQLTATGYPHRIGGTFDPEFAKEEFLEKDIAYDPATIPIPAYLPDTPEVRQDLCEYYRYISRFDLYVGDTLDALEKSGRKEETMVILLSDHGMPFPGAKASSFEAAHHCPLIIHHPDVAAGGTTNALVNWCDILPTILEGLSVPRKSWPTSLPGRSLLPLFATPEAAGWEEPIAYSHTFHEVTNYFPYRVMRGTRYKYVSHLAYQLDLPLPTDLYDSPSYYSIREIGGTSQRTHTRLLRHDREALFDLWEDPYENNNLINDPAYKDILTEYRERLTQLRKTTRDPWLEIDFQEGRLSERAHDRKHAANKEY